MFKRIFRLDLKDAPKDVYIWAIISGMLYSGSTMLLSIIANRCIGDVAAGIYTVALSIGNQLVTVGYWNTRTYQASDLSENVKFNDYFCLKVLTALLMLILCPFFILIQGYNGTKAVACVIMTVFKCIEVFGDVFEGRYQQQKRFDVSSKSLLARTAVFILAFCITAFITHNLIVSLIVMTICYGLCFLAVDGRLISYFGGVRVKFNFSKISTLAIACFPLMVNSFLLMYINQAAKLSVDQYYGSAIVARFNALFMIAFVINMFSSVILKPIINQLSVLFSERKMKDIYLIMLKQGALIFGLTVVCLIGAYLLGTQVLSIVYGFDLTGFKFELCIMLLGGSCTALYQVFQNIIIIMRHQMVCLIGCILTTIVTFIVTPLCVSSMEIMGGAVSYMISMGFMAIVYGIFTVYYLIAEGKHND